jgi:hypothetical protein
VSTSLLDAGPQFTGTKWSGSVGHSINGTVACVAAGGRRSTAVGSHCLSLLRAQSVATGALGALHTRLGKVTIASLRCSGLVVGVRGGGGRGDGGGVMVIVVLMGAIVE